MIVLHNYNDIICQFIVESVQKFEKLHGKPNSIGIYCCPWSGWLTTNFNLRISLPDTGENCPDFEFVEFDSLDFPQWQSEYESDEAEYQLGNSIIKYTHEGGDEELNEIFFSYLLPVMKEVKRSIDQTILLQLLDSNCRKVL